MAATSTLKIEIPSTYAFLSQLPPQKKLPAVPLPTPPPLPGRSKAFASITAWAAHVQPGSPPPCTPLRPRASASSRRRSASFGGRRPSLSQLLAPPPTFTKGDSPLSAIASSPWKELSPDLTSLGYSTLFIHLPRAPRSTPKPESNLVQKPAPIKSGVIKRIRSLVMLKRIRSRANSLPPSPKDATKPKTDEIKRRKFKAYPPPLGQELALAQFTAGGTIDSHVSRAVEARAKAAGGTGVAGVYRDVQGGIWWDEDEEKEYEHLLAEDAPEPWVTFGARPADRHSASTVDSDLDPRREVRPADHEFGSRPGPGPTPGMSVLAVPMRRRRGDAHLQKPEFLVDVAFSLDRPDSPCLETREHLKGSERRRPAPLKLVPPTPRPVEGGNAFETSFTPHAKITTK